MDIEWIKSFCMEAKTDLESAEELFRVGKYGRVTFLAEQCVEKIIKAFLLCRGVEIVKKHDITPLLVDTLTKEEIEEFDKLIRYSIGVQWRFYMKKRFDSVGFQRNARKELSKIKCPQGAEQDIFLKS